MTASATGLFPTAARVGESVKIICQGFNPDSPLTITVGTTYATIAGQNTTGVHGSLTATFIVPQVVSGLRKVTVTDTPPSTGPFSVPALGSFHTAVSAIYLDVSPALLPQSPVGPGTPTTPIPAGPSPFPPQLGGTIGPGGTFTQAPIVAVAGISESAAALRATEGWDYFRGVVGGGFTEAEYLFEDLSGSLLETGTAVTFAEVGAGTTVDILSFPVVAFAAALLLSEYAFGWVLTKVARLFPNPSIFGWRPLNFIVTGINSFGHQFEQSATGLGDRVASVFTQPIRQILGLFQRSGNATAAAHNKIGHVVRSTIPTAQAAAVTSANTYTDAQVAALHTQINAAIARINGAGGLGALATMIADANTRITGISDALGPIHQAQQLNTAQLAPYEAVGAIALPTLLATLSSTLHNLKTKVDTCMVDNCDTTSPNYLKTALMALLLGLTDAAELAFIAEAVRNPLGTADTLAPGLEAVDAAAVATLNALLSL